MSSPGSNKAVPSNVRLLVLDTPDEQLTSLLRAQRPENTLRIDTVQSTSEAITRIEQRASTGSRYPGVVTRSSILDEKGDSLERIWDANNTGLLVLVGDEPNRLDVDERRTFVIDDDVDEATWKRQLDVVLAMVEAHADALELEARLRGTKSENETLRNRLGLAEKRVQHLNRVFHHSRDPVTGVANREFLVESLEIELEHHRRIVQYEFALCILEIDDYDQHLETLGLETLNKALVQITSRIIDTLRATDRVGRLNDHRFGIILGDSPSTDDVRTATTRLLESLSSTLAVEGSEIDLEYSIGVAVSGPQHHSPSDLIQDANLAVADSRSSRHSDLTIYEQQYAAESVEDTAIARDMAKQLETDERDEFYLTYQPIYHLSEGSIVGFEALCRWEHPERGHIPPNKFIAIAEQSNLILDLGLWIVEKAIKRLERWGTFEDVAQPPFITVNLSKQQIQSEELAESVIEMLKNYEIEAQQLIVELRETSAIEQHDAAVTNLGQLKSYGVRVAVDDFGVAHSSFASLYRLPVEILKIDRSLVERLKDERDRARTIVRHLVELCDDMGLMAIAEGVETDREHAGIVDLGCAYAQGYLYDKELRGDEADNRLLSTAEMDTAPIFYDS